VRGREPGVAALPGCGRFGGVVPRCAGVPGLLTLTGLVEPDGRIPGYGQSGGDGEVQRVEVDVGHAAVEADRFVVTESDSAAATSAVITPSLRTATATRVWQRQSMEWIAAVFAADPTPIPRSISRRLQVVPANSNSADCLRSELVALRNSVQVA